MRAAQAKVNFNSGELSPLLHGRADTAAYGAGARRLLNYLPLVQGPVSRRPGTRYVAKVKDSGARCWLVPFQYSVSQAYMLEFGPGYIRIFVNHGPLTSGGLPVEVVTPWTAADLTDSNGRFRLRLVQSNDVLYIASGTRPLKALSRLAAANWTLSDVVLSGGPFNDMNVDQGLTVTVSGETGTVSLTASGAVFSADMAGTLFRLQELNPGGDVPAWETDVGVAAGNRRRSNGNTYHALAGGTTGSTKIVHTEGTASDGNVTWQYLHSGYGVVRIDAVANATSATGTVVSFLASPSVASYKWRKALFAAGSGYPELITWFRDRLVLLRGNIGAASVAGDYLNFASHTGPEVTADSAMTFKIQSRTNNALRWAAPVSSLLLGTGGGEWVLEEQTAQDAFGPLNYRIVAKGASGSENIEPVQVGGTVLHVQRGGRKLRELTYDEGLGTWKFGDTTVFAEHLTQGGLVQMTYVQEPQPLVWANRQDGALVAFTYSAPQEVHGWSRHLLGGVSDSQGSPAVVESVAQIPTPDGTADELWLIVRRLINGLTVRTVEYMAQPFNSGLDPLDYQDEADYRAAMVPLQAGACYYDCSAEYAGAAVTRLSGLDWLEGQTVGVLADGGAHPDCIVTGGTITLDGAAARVQVGLAYDSVLVGLPLEVASQAGTTQARLKRITSVALRVFETLGIEAGPAVGALDEIEIRVPQDAMDSAPPLVTGKLPAIPWPGGYDLDATMTVRQRGGFPGTIIGLYPDLEASA